MVVSDRTKLVMATGDELVAVLYPNAIAGLWGLFLNLFRKSSIKSCAYTVLRGVLFIMLSIYSHVNS